MGNLKDDVWLKIMFALFGVIGSLITLALAGATYTYSSSVDRLERTDSKLEARIDRLESGQIANREYFETRTQTLQRDLGIITSKVDILLGEQKRK